MKRFVIFTVAALAAASFSSSAMAGTLYALSDFAGSSKLISIDTGTGAGTTVATVTGAAGSAFIGLTWDGTQFLSIDAATDRLYAINLAGTATLIGATGEDDIEGYLDFDPVSGKLYGGWRNLYQISTATGAASFIGATGRDDPSGLAFDGLGNAYLMDTHVNTGGAAELFTINTGTGATTSVGPWGPKLGDALGGLAFDGGVLYGIWADSLYSINTTTGAATLIGATGFSEVASLASVTLVGAQVPLPTSALMGLGMRGVLGAFRFRRRS